MTIASLTFLPAAMVANTVQPSSPKAQTVSFLKDIHPILTRYGCSQGACHGSAAGRGDFTLSLLAGEPDTDYQTLVFKNNGRLIVSHPETLPLLLEKAIGQRQHGGGLRFTTGSKPYHNMTQWLRQGTPGPIQTDICTSVKVQSKSTTLAPQQTISLNVIATYADGTTRSVTELSLFDSLDDHVATVSPFGTIRAMSPGIARFRIRYSGRVTAINMIIRNVKKPAAPYQNIPTSQYIDQDVQDYHRYLNLASSQRASESALLRRLSFDLTGAAPSAADELAFIGAYRNAKQFNSYVNVRLASDTTINRWTQFLAETLRIDSASIGKQRSIDYSQWLMQQFQRDQPWNSTIAKLFSTDDPKVIAASIGFWSGQRDPRDQAERVAQIVLGTRISCARCHKHPYDQWTVDDHTAYANLYSGLRVMTNTIVPDPLRTIPHPRTGLVPPGRLLGSHTSVTNTISGRDALASDAKGSRQLARVMVNRVWREMFGVGLVEPIDDVRTSNPSHFPKVLETLTDRFIQHKQSIQWLILTIVSSKTYQKAADVVPSTHRQNLLLSHAPRRIFGSILDDHIAFITQTPNPEFEGSAQSQFDNRLASRSLDALERCKRDGSVQPDGVESETLGSAIYRLSSPSVEARINAGASHLARTRDTFRTHVRRLWQRALTRPITPPEWQRVASLERGQTLTGALSDVLWVLINHPEFEVKP